MVRMWDLKKIEDINSVVNCCPYKKTFKECSELVECSMYSDRVGCVPYDVQFLWG